MKNATGILIHLPSNRLLLLRDKKDHLWCVPGGKIDPADRNTLHPEFTAFKREYEEETGYELPELTIYSKFDYGIHAHTKIYVATFTEDVNFRVNNEMDQLALVDLDELINSDFDLPDYPLKLYCKNSLKFANLESGHLELSFNLANGEDRVNFPITESTFKPALEQIVMDQVIPFLDGNQWRINLDYKNSKTLNFIFDQLSQEGIMLKQDFYIPMNTIDRDGALFMITTEKYEEDLGPVLSKR